MRYRACAKFIIMLLLVLKTLGVDAVNDTAAPPDPVPVCAIIADKALDLHASPLVALLEANLSEDEKLSLVERMEIDRVLQEQQLQLLFSAEGGTQRVALGRLLKADLLVLLQAGEKESARYVDVIVSETKGGLRFLVWTVVWTDDPQGEAEAVHALVERGLAKYGEKITEICAVPPFVSKDLAHKYDYLQTAYATLIEQTLLELKGIAVVELAEARAITRELALAGTASHVTRNLPLYILGEYRNEGIDEDRRVSLSLTLQRGETQLRAVKKAGLSPDEVATFLREGSLEMLEGLVKAEQSLPDPEIEAQQLAERARVFTDIAAWPEAVALIEASLLLKPDQPQCHYDAVYVLTRLVRSCYDSDGDMEQFKRKANIGFDYYRLGLGHVEAFLRSTIFHEGHEYGNFMGELWGAAGNIEGYARDRAPEIKAICLDLHREKRDLVLRVMEAKAAAGELNDATVDMFIHIVPGRPGLWESAEENYALRLHLIRLVKDLLRAHYWTSTLATWDILPLQKVSPAYGEFIQQIATIPGEKVQAAAEEVWQQYQAAITPKQPAPQEPAKPVTPVDEMAADITFHKLELACEDSSGLGWSSVPRLSGWLPCGNGTDVVWGLKELFLMKEKGRLKRIYKSEERSFNFQSLCYDGQYVWAPAKSGEESLVLVIDPETEQIFEFTAEDGLPRTSFGVAAAPLAPGKICLAGGFRKIDVGGAPDRGWCALLEVSENGAKSVDVFHEARLHMYSFDRYGEEIWDPHNAFSPSFMAVITDKVNNAGKRVLLGRTSIPGPASDHPLLIDPEARTVEVLRDRMWRPTCYEGDVYWVMLDPKIGDPAHTPLAPNLWRLGFPDFKKTTVISSLPGKGLEGGPVAFFNGRVHVVGRHWWTAGRLDDKFTHLQAKIPGGKWYLRELCPSNHYGLLLLTHQGGDDHGAYSVEFRNRTQ